MIRTTTMAALALTLMSSAAFAQANRPPAQLSGGSSSSPAYDDRDYDDRDYDASYDRRDAPPPASAPAQNGSAARDDQARADRDIYCRRSAAASTGYVTPGQAARNEQAAGSIGGTLGGAALGAIIGSASNAAGPGALIGAGAGLLAGTAIGSSNARAAAADVQAAYGDAYYACMDGREPQPAQYAYGPPPPPPVYYGPPPPPVYYAPAPYPYPYYYGRPYYGPSVRLNFGFGGGWGHGGWGRRR